MGYAHVKGKSDLDEKLAGAKRDGRLVVVDWFAPWCGPCQRIAPLFEALASQHTESLFLSVNSEDPSNKLPVNLPQAHSIRGFPTFTFYVDGQEVERMVGANYEKLQNTVDRLEGQIEENQLAEALRMSTQTPTEAKKPEKNIVADADGKLPSLDGANTINITVKRVTGDSHQVEVEHNASVLVLKRRIHVKMGQKCPPEAQRLIFQGRILKDDQTIDDIGIKDGFTLHISIKQTTPSKTSYASTSESIAAKAKGTDLGDGEGEGEKKRALKDALSALVTANGKEKAEKAIFVLQLYTRNIARHPQQMKYRKIRVGNQKFTSTIKVCRGYEACMKALGFELQNISGEDYWIMDIVAHIDVLQKEIDDTLLKLRGSPFSGGSGSTNNSGNQHSSPGNQTQTNTSNPFQSMGMPSAFGTGFPGMGGMGGMGGMPAMNPAAMSQLLSNPAVQNMMQNPAMQSVMQRMRQRSLAGENPLNPSDMMQMMADPSMQQLMQDPSFINNIVGTRAALGLDSLPGSGQGSGFNLNSIYQQQTNQTQSSGNGNSASSSNLAGGGRENSPSSNSNEDEDDLDDLDDIYAE